MKLAVLIFCCLLSNLGLSAVDDIEKMITQGQLDAAELAISKRLINETIDAVMKTKLLALQGDLWFYRKDYNQAQLNYQQALKQAEIIKHQQLKAEQMKNIAITYSEMTNYGAALKWHDSALKVLKLEDKVHSQQQTELSILLSQGMIFAYVGASELALETLAQAQNLAYQSNNLMALNNAYLRLAALHFENHRYNLSMNSLTSINPNVFSDISDLSWFYGLKLNVLLATEDWQEAERVMDEITHHSMQWTATFLDEIKVLEVQLSLAKNQLQRAQTLIEELQNTGSHRKSWVVPHLNAALKMQMNDPISAMTFHQLAIQQFLLQQSKHQQLNSNFNVPASLFNAAIHSASLTGYQNEAEIFNWLSWAMHNSQMIAMRQAPNLENENTATKGQNEVVTDVINRQFADPIYAFDLSQLKAILGPEEAVLIYLKTEFGLMAFLITRDDFKLVELSAKGVSTQNKVAKLISQLKLAGGLWEQTAMELNQILLDPLRDVGLDEFTHLHIIPDESLRFMPFELLLDEQGMMVLDRFQLVLNSFQGLGELIQHRSDKLIKQAKKTRLSFLGTNNNLPEMPNYWRTAYRNLEFSTRDFQGIKAEHQLVKQFKMPGQVIFNQSATESKALEIIRNETGILHLSSHGFDNPVAPAFSALVLNSDSSSDGLLQAREVMQGSSQLSLLVLASCSSAKGGLEGRYGNQLGLADAFIQTGVQAVIGTLWDVKDLSTAQFMQWFYQSLSQVHVPAIALKETKLKARNAGWPAHDWSAFVMLGDSRTVVIMKPLKSQSILDYFRWGMPMTIVILLVVFGIINFKQNSRTEH
jgi:CHAT domain-containing protein